MPSMPERKIQGGRSGHGTHREGEKVPVRYKGITFCDQCGKALEDGQWLVGLCRGCEEAKAPKRPVETLTPGKALRGPQR